MLICLQQPKVVIVTELLNAKYKLELCSIWFFPIYEFHSLIQYLLLYNKNTTNHLFDFDNK